MVKIIDLLKHPEKMNQTSAEWLRGMVQKYPYYQTARLLFLENLYRIHDKSFDFELRNSALLLTDRSVLFNLVEGNNYIIPEQYSKENVIDTEKNVDRTLSLIEGYLKLLPFEGQKKQEATDKNTQTSKTDPLTDYTAYLVSLDEDLSEDTDGIANFSDTVSDVDLIDEKSDKKTKTKITLPDIPTSQTLDADDEELSNVDYYTETLAQIFIKQKKYERALEIIKVLRANNPEKNRYFAEQMRFIEQLIAINKINNIE